MNKREDFEQFLVELCDFPGQDEKVRAEIKSALERIRTNPSLFCGDPDGDFFYEDPILAKALFYYTESKDLRLVTASGNKKPIRNNRILEWAWAGIQAFINDGHISYLRLGKKQPKNSIKLDKETLHLAVIGDAGYNNSAQSKVLNKIRERHEEYSFDFLIHLGDIYFAGGEKAVLKHFLAPFKEAVPDVLALLGNHELYMGGESFSLLIDALRQPGRYFALENDHWIIACLDTSLPSPSIRRLDGQLDREQVKWLKKTIRNSDKKGFILMSHHYIVSSWGNTSPELERQIKPISSNIFSWYWGHEHSCAVYDKTPGLGFYGACVGNGAFSEKKSPPQQAPYPAWFADGFCGCFGKKTKDWQHGYLELEITPTSVRETYHLEDKTFERTLDRVQ